MNLIATPSKTRAIINKYGLRMHKALGQNFLIEPKFIKKIVEAAEIEEHQAVIEIGPGIGALTESLAEKAAEVIALELDRSLIDVLNDIFRDKTNVHVVYGDALKVDFDQLVEEKLGKEAMPYKVVANLPYYITTPIIMRLLEGGFHFSSLVLMVQKEVARRMSALPGTKEYGALSIGVQYYCKPQFITTVPPTVFYPQPEVDSAVIRLDKREHPAVDVIDEKVFFNLVKASFGQRRKTLLNALSSSAYRLKKEEWQQLLEGSRLDPKRRGETLSLEEFAALANNFCHYYHRY